MVPIGSLFAGILFDAFVARQTLDLAAPVERTSALPAARVYPRVITPTAAQPLAAAQRVPVRPRHAPIAAPTARSQRPGPHLRLAVGGRRVQVDEVASNRLRVGVQTPSQAQEDGLHGALASNRLHAAGAPISRRQAVADGTEPRQSDPARLHRTRSRYAVTLAVRCYRISQRLRHTTPTQD